MAENKTKPTSASVTDFLDRVKEPQKREDSYALLDMMRSVSKQEPVMWGPSIVGFGTYHYVYASGREGDTVILGFSPRKEALSIYMMCSLDQVADDLPELGKYKTGKGCLYIKSLKDVDAAVLKKILTKAWKAAKAKK